MKPKELADAVRGILWQEKFRGTLEEIDAQRRFRLEEIANLLPSPKLPKPSPQEPGWPTCRVGFGTYGWKYDSRLVERLVHPGIFSLIDTAEGYGFGRCESALGEILQEYPERRTWVASKVARNHLSAAATYNAGVRSRDRLKIPSIDLYQIHWPPPDGDFRPVMEGLSRLKDRKVIDRVGVCNCSVPLLANAMRTAQEYGLRVESLQIRVNPSDRGAVDYLLPVAKRLGLRVIAYSPLAQGELRGRVRESLGWSLAQGVDYVLPRTNKLEHLAENLSLDE